MLLRRRLVVVAWKIMCNGGNWAASGGCKQGDDIFGGGKSH